MTTLEQVAKIIEVGVANQPAYIQSRLRDLGYNNNKFQASGYELATGLWKLYADDKVAFYDVLKGLNFDPTKTNLSTDGSIVTAALDSGWPQTPTVNAKGIVTSGLDLKGAWDWLIGTVAGKDTTTVNPTIVTTSSISTGAIIGLVVVAILAAMIVYFAFIKKSA